MGTKSQGGGASSKKKKGPKGKKARAKAKLERQWGELPKEEPAATTKTVSRGKYHRLPVPTERNNSHDNNNMAVATSEPTQRNHFMEKGETSRVSRHHHHSFSARSPLAPPKLSRRQRAKLRFQQIKKNQKHGGGISTNHDSFPESDDDTSHSDDDDDNDEGSVPSNDPVETNQYGTSSFLESLRPKNRSRRSQYPSPEDDGTKDSYEDDDDDSLNSSNNNDGDEEMAIHAADSVGDVDPMDQTNVSDERNDTVPAVTQHEPMALDCNPFLDRFVTREPLPEDDLERNKAWEKCIGTNTVTLKSPPTVDTSMVLQASTNVVEDLQLPNHPNAALSERDCQQLACSLFAQAPPLLLNNWKQQKQAKQQRTEATLGAHQSLLYPFVANYCDVMYTCDTRINRVATERLLAFHILHHVWRSRQQIHRNNKKVMKRNKEDDEDPDQSNVIMDTSYEEMRDQGFTRATVLILLPTRGCCHSMVHLLLSLLCAKETAENLERFNTEYGPPPLPEESAEKGDEDQLRRRRKVQQQKGIDWLELFGDDVNDDDDFKIGLALHPKGRSGQQAGDAGNTQSSEDGSCSVKLFADFFKSDIILASPLGLKMTMTAEDNQRQADFLSSIEICLLARSDVMLMQNWDHVQDVLKQLNQQPKNSNGTDFSRVRNYMLLGQACHWRQLIIESSFLDPLILSTFKRNAKSLDGYVRIRKKTDPEEASISKVLLPTRQVFQRVEATSFANQGEVRVRYFAEKVLPHILSHKQKHTLVFIPSYFDFVSVRNLLLKREVEFVSVSEYSRITEISRGRARFLQGRKPIMLYSGRAHFFHRHKIKGVRHVIFVGLPEHAEFYAQQVNLLQAGDNDMETSAAISSLTLFTKYDSHALERIVGTTNCLKMINGDKSSYLIGA